MKQNAVSNVAGQHLLTEDTCEQLKFSSHEWCDIKKFLTLSMVRCPATAGAMIPDVLAKVLDSPQMMLACFGHNITSLTIMVINTYTYTNSC